MSYARAKNVAYDDLDDTFDDEEYYSEDQEEELSPEDEAQMHEGTLKVKAALGSDFPVTDREIRDALWNFFYDIDQSVAHLKSLRKTNKSGSKKKKKQTGDTPAKAANEQISGSVQSTTGKAQKLSPSHSPSNSASTLSDSVAQLSLGKSRVVSKNLNVEEEYQHAKMKKTAAFVVVGHVDHGKSTLMGRLLYDSKAVDENTMRKFRKESEAIGKGSFALAWVMDTSADERARGITVDTATKSFETETTRFTILDAPGHQDFIPNMIVGAQQADFAVLVIDAGINSFESGLRGQTKEHALLVRSMGVTRLIVAVNKMDRVDWSQERFEEIKTAMAGFLTTANFSAKSVRYIPCAGLSGENVLMRITAPEAKWYTGPTLIEELEKGDSKNRAIEKALRMVVSEVSNSVHGSDMTISGKIDSGSLQVGDQIIARPGNELATIKVIEADWEPAEWAVAGQMVKLSLVTASAEDIKRGDIVCSAKDPIPMLTEVTVKILAFEFIMPSIVEVLRGRFAAPGTVKKLVASLDKTTGEIEKKNPRRLSPGSVGRVVISLDRPMPIEAGWKIVLRQRGATVATGIVE
ncbi:hypothetical protein BT63DRAFT_424128 [Microthyrium microscopicum]|uniref:Elongation factor 1 alpha-like protein n=1 Tax=Microthyrium microscopicum TaxID=703497 RepID=A0A6A6UFB1_9PEZI|nr:hypothetical protein BT63DRAFT_424128 [Microthyrium microscopicum]